MLKLSILLVAVLATFVNANSIDLELDFDLDGRDPNTIEPYIFESVVKDFFDKIVGKLKPLDPMLVPNIDLDVGQPPLYAKLNMEDLIARGFSKMEMTEIKISVIGFKATFKIDCDVIQFVAPYYKLDALAVFIPFYGSGTFNLRVVGLAFKGSAKLNLNGLTIKDLKLEFLIDESNLTVTGFLDNEPLSEIISSSVTECFPVFVKNYGKRLGELASGIVESMLNEALKPKPKPPQPEPEPEPEPQIETYRRHKLNF